jgi:hypothetical protein
MSWNEATRLADLAHVQANRECYIRQKKPVKQSRLMTSLSHRGPPGNDNKRSPALLERDHPRVPDSTGCFPIAWYAKPLDRISEGS